MPTWFPWAVAGAVVLLLVALLVRFAGGTEANNTPSASSPSATASSASSSSPVTTAGAAGALLDLSRQLAVSGQLDEHTASDIEHAVNDVLHRGGEDGDPEKVRETLGELRDKIAESVDKGETTPEAASQLDAAIATLEATLPQD